MKTNSIVKVAQSAVTLILLSSVLLACNYENTNIENKIDQKQKDIDTSVSCTFALDTFFFKGIGIDNKVNDLKYKLKKEYVPKGDVERIISHRNSRIFSFGNFQTYSVVDVKSLSLFKNKIRSIKIHTYKNKIFGIDIFIVEESDKLFHINRIQGLFAEKFNIPPCGYVNNSILNNSFREENIRTIDVKSPKLSIKTFIDSINEKNKYGSKGTDNEYLKALRIEITKISTITMMEKEIAEESAKSKENVKNDF